LESFDKHGWLQAVQADTQFSDREFRLAQAVQADTQFSDREFRLAFVICSQFTRRDGTGWPVELDRIATAVKGGMHSVKIRNGLSKLCKAGYLAETYRRSTGPGLDRSAVPRRLQA